MEVDKATERDSSFVIAPVKGIHVERARNAFDDAKYRRDLASLLRAELQGRSI